MYLYNKNILMEQWKAIVGYEGLYEVSNMGNIKSLAKQWICGEHNIVRIKPETLLKSTPNSAGYLIVNLYNNKVHKSHKIHRLVATYFLPVNSEKKPQVNHKDGVKSNCNYWNLEWATNSENQLHSYKLGLRKPLTGKNVKNLVLTKRQVYLIRKKYSTGNFLQKQLAKTYKVSESTINGIISNRSWKHI